MEIRVLRYFLAVAREGNITAAANFLHLTQPTLPRQIKDLEEELGQKLFIRGSHRMTLTPEGMILRKRAEEILSMVEKTFCIHLFVIIFVSLIIFIRYGGIKDETLAVCNMCRITVVGMLRMQGGNGGRFAGLCIGQPA